MTDSEITIEIVHSNLVDPSVFSEEDPDFRVLDQFIRLTEQTEPRDLEDGNKRLLE